MDDNGFLVITGRKKNVIVKNNGKNVFPEELEAYIARDPMVGDAVVLGIMNEKKKDYDIVAAVYPDADYAKETLGAGYTREAVEAHIKAVVDNVNSIVQTYKRMDVVIVTDTEFPKNSSKKIKRFEVPAMLMDKYLEKIN